MASMAGAYKARRARKVKPQEIPVNGELIRFRLPQTIGYGLIYGLIFANVVAGGYFGIFQVNWHIFYLKDWWDDGMSRYIVPGFFAASTWTFYRHGLRNLLEPAAATFGVKSLMAKKWVKNDIRLGPFALIFRVILVLVTAIALVLGGIWLLHFGFEKYLPFGWHFNPEAGILGKYSVGELVLGIAVIGQVVHFIWAPAGNTLQGFFSDLAVTNIKAKRERLYQASLAADPESEFLDLSYNWLPWWVIKPFPFPPIVRERVAYVLDNNVEVKSHGKVDAGAIITVALILFLFFCLGVVGHYLDGVFGLHIPFLAP